jgi:hypothetical protein
MEEIADLACVDRRAPGGLKMYGGPRPTAFVSLAVRVGVWSDTTRRVSKHHALFRVHSSRLEPRRWAQGPPYRHLFPLPSPSPLAPSPSSLAPRP